MSSYASRPHALVSFAVVMAAVYLVLPAHVGVEALRILAPAIAIGAILIGVAANQPRRPGGWYLFVAGFAAQAVGALVWSTRYFGGDATSPSVVEMFRLLAALFLLVGVARMSQDDQGEMDAFGSIETAIVAIATGVGVWLLVIEPSVSERSLPFGERAWAVLIPLVGALSLAIGIRFAVQSRFRERSPRLIAVGLGVTLLADALRSVLDLRDRYGPGGLVAALSITAPLLLAAAALDDSMAPRNRPTIEAAGFGRVIGLSVAALTPLTVLFALTVTDLGTWTTRTVAAASALTVVVLALARMWGLVATVRVLTERRGQDRLAAMVEHSSDVVMLVDEDGDIRYASPGLSSTLGHRASDWISRPVIDLVVNDDRSSAERQLQALVALGPGGTVKFEASLVRVDGQRRRMEATIANLIGGEAVDGIVATFRDVTEQRDLEKQLSHRAFHDELTGLANRALFLDRMDHALRITRLDSDPVVVLFVDLDDFKSVNDALGHSVGDQLLRHIADQIRVTAGSGDTPARLGGDEFAILLEDRGGVDRALGMAESLLDMLREPVMLGGYDLTVLASVGVAVATQGMSTSSLLRDADIAMYEAKRAGKGQIKIFDPAMRLGATKHLEFRSELSTAVETGQLRLVFQPQIDMRTGEVIGAEALVRWRHPERGDVMPDEFVPIAERSGLINTIGAWTIDESVRHAKRWQRSGPREMSVNVSAVQLRYHGFVDQVATALRTHDLDPGRLTLEITETVLVNEIEAASDVLADLRALGVRIAIDDFGTGYCSLSYLQRFPVDIVKIDKQFVDELAGDRRSSSLAQMILQMTTSLGVTSVAEGIERPEQVTALRRMGCDIGQGFLLSRPLEADVIMERFGLVLPPPMGPAAAPPGSVVSTAPRTRPQDTTDVGLPTPSMN
ncbi:MAG: EAL domain-containing protein [Ilumatobacter sp.]|nr:EAL domain-containing protein [Ilumatobacter sp.]